MALRGVSRSTSSSRVSASRKKTTTTKQVKTNTSAAKAAAAKKSSSNSKSSKTTTKVTNNSAAKKAASTSKSSSKPKTNTTSKTNTAAKAVAKTTSNKAKSAVKQAAKTNVTVAKKIEAKANVSKKTTATKSERANVAARTKAASTATRTVAKKANTVANTVASKVSTVKSTTTNSKVTTASGSSGKSEDVASRKVAQKTTSNIENLVSKLANTVADSIKMGMRTKTKVSVSDNVEEKAYIAPEVSSEKKVGSWYYIDGKTYAGENDVKITTGPLIGAKDGDDIKYRKNFFDNLFNNSSSKNEKDDEKLTSKEKADKNGGGVPYKPSSDRAYERESIDKDAAKKGFENRVTEYVDVAKTVITEPKETVEDLLDALSKPKETIGDAVKQLGNAIYQYASGDNEYRSEVAGGLAVDTLATVVTAGTAKAISKVARSGKKVNRVSDTLSSEPKGSIKTTNKKVISEGGSDTIIKNGKVSIDDIKTNPSAFSGKSAEEIADVLRKSGYDVTIKNSTRSRSGAQIIQINNPGGGKNISQVQVSPGGGRHGSNPYVKISTTDQGIIKIVDGIESTYKTDGKETATIIFSGGN